MPLKSPRFAGNPRLESAAKNAPTIKFGERDTEAVKAVQQAYIDLGFAMPVSTMKGRPDGIFGAETQKVTRAFQTKHKLAPDGIVGRDTMAKLDELFPAPEKPSEPPPSQSKPVIFQPLRRKEGWDGSVNPHWHMVPLGGQRRLLLENGEGLEVVSTIPSIVTVEEAPICLIANKREFILKGRLKGNAFVQARRGNKMEAQVEIGVKRPAELPVSFHYVRDSAGHHTMRNPADLDGLISKVNDILGPQANVWVVRHNAFNTFINRDLGPVVRSGGDDHFIPESEDEWPFLAAKADRTAKFNVFFVWDLELDDTPDVDDFAGGAKNSNCAIQDRPGKDRTAESVLAHEIGHLLGCGHSGKGLDLLMSHSRSDDRIERDQINKMNP